MPKLKNQLLSASTLVNEMEPSRVLGIGELRVRLGVFDDQLGDDDHHLQAYAQLLENA